MPSLKLASVFRKNSNSSMPKDLRKTRNAAVVASPTPTVGILLGSTTLTRAGIFRRRSSSWTMKAVIQPAVPPPTMTKCGSSLIGPLIRFSLRKL